MIASKRRPDASPSGELQSVFNELLREDAPAESETGGLHEKDDANPLDIGASLAFDEVFRDVGRPAPTFGGLVKDDRPYDERGKDLSR